MGRRDTLDKLLKALENEKRQDRRQQQRRSNGWDCRCGCLDNRPTRATCRDCGAKAPQAFLRRLEQRNRQSQSSGAATAGQAPRRSPAPTARTDELKPSWADILAGSPAARQPNKTAGSDPPAPTAGAPPDEASAKEAALQDELKKARAMLATAKSSDLDSTTVEQWQSKVNAITKLLDQNRPHDARLRSLLDRKKDRETRLEKLAKDEQEAEAALQDIRTNKETAKAALVEIEAEIDSLTAPATPAPVPTIITPADAIMQRLVFEPDPVKQQALISVLKDLGCTNEMIQQQGQFLHKAAAAAASQAAAGPAPATPVAAGAPTPNPPPQGAQKRPADPTPAEARARLEAATAARAAADAEARAMEALLEPTATPVANLQEAIEAAEAAEAEAAKKARTTAPPPTVPDDSDADDERMG